MESLFKLIPEKVLGFKQEGSTNKSFKIMRFKSREVR